MNKKLLIIITMLFLLSGCTDSKRSTGSSMVVNNSTDESIKHENEPVIENPDGFNVTEGKYEWFGRDGANSYITILPNNRFEIDTDIDPKTGEFVERYKASGYYKFTEYTEEYPDGSTYDSYFIHFYIDDKEVFGYGYVGKTSFTDQWSGYQLIK